MSTPVEQPARLATAEDYLGHVPVHVVWELTLACNLKCAHCGSRAGKPRPDELTTAECLEVVEQLARLGVREVTLIGGEAFLRRDWLEIVAAIRDRGMLCTLQTGARHFTARRIRDAVDAGLGGFGVSIDGLEETHDRIRGVEGSYGMAISAIEEGHASGLKVGVNTVIGAFNGGELPELLERIADAGAVGWQVQFAVAMGNAVDDPDLLLQPFQLLEIMPRLAQLYHRARNLGLLLVPGNNVGYFGPYEALWRNAEPLTGHWSGCAAGQRVIGLEADGTVKGCPSLATVGYSGGNVRDLSIAEIWNGREALHFGRLRSVESLWGFCRTCYYADLCRAGCTWTADSLWGRPGNNPYCHHRVLELEKKGLRERVVKRRDAPNAPFAIGEFELVQEPIPGRTEPIAPSPTSIENAKSGEPLVQLGRARSLPARITAHVGRIPRRLEICQACDRHILPEETACPHCGADIRAAREEYEAEASRRQSLVNEVQKWLASAT